MCSSELTYEPWCLSEQPVEWLQNDLIPLSLLSHPKHRLSQRVGKSSQAQNVAVSLLPNKDWIRALAEEICMTYESLS